MTEDNLGEALPPQSIGVKGVRIDRESRRNAAGNSPVFTLEDLAQIEQCIFRSADLATT